MFNGGNPGIGRAAKIDIHQNGFRFVECTGFGQVLGRGKGRGPEAEKLQLPDQAARHFLVGQRNVNGRSPELVGCLGVVEVRTAQGALGEGFDGIPEFPFQGFIQR